DLFVAADQVRQRRELHRAGVRRRVQPDERLLDESAVLADQRALDTPYLGPAEWIERGSAHATHGVQRAEDAVEPPAALHLALPAQRAQQRRMPVVVGRGPLRVLVP